MLEEDSLEFDAFLKKNDEKVNITVSSLLDIMVLVVSSQLLANYSLMQFPCFTSIKESDNPNNQNNQSCLYFKKSEKEYACSTCKMASLKFSERLVWNLFFRCKKLSRELKRTPN